MSKRVIIILVVLGVLTILSIGVYYLRCSFLARCIKNITETNLEVKSGDSSLQVATKLQEQNLISFKWFFLILLKLKGGIIKAGFYEFSPFDDSSEIISKLTSGQVMEWIITFPEGFSLKDMANRLEEKKVIKKEDFLKEVSLVSKYKNLSPDISSGSRTLSLAPLADQNDYSFLSGLTNPNLEGYLFPDTYHFSYRATEEEIVKKMLDNFKKKTAGKSIDHKTIILASIIEREAKKPEERPKIASVYLNRLSKNMKLEADPTVQYAKGSWDKITLEDYKIASPYNTYKYQGLPPGPICNPGLESILAVLNPEKTNYLYFFHTQDGQTIFSTTKEEHEQRKREYLN